LQNAIYLQPLTREQINYYFDIAGSQLAAVRNLWQEDETLQELAHSPLMLDIMTLAYQGLESEDLPIIDSIEGRRKHLFDKYIERMFQRRFKKERYKKEDSMRWLIWLAKRMSCEKETVFLIEDLQPNSLLNIAGKWIYYTCYVLATGIIIHLIDCFYWTFILKWIAQPYHQLSLTIYDGIIEIIIVILINFFLSFLNPLSFGIGLFWGTLNLLISQFRNKKHIITFERISFSKKQIKNSFMNGSKNGVIPGIFSGFIFMLVFDRDYLFFLWDNYVPQIKAFWGITTFTLLLFFIKLVNEKYQNNSVIFVLSLVSFICAFILVLKLQNMLLFSFFGALFGGLIGVIMGMREENLEVTMIPNQGIFNSIRNAILFALISGLILGSIGALIYWSNEQLFVLHTSSNSVLYYIIDSGFYGFYFALIPGFPVIKHFTLRIILYFKKYIPWNYARFLDYATERIFLQKVGGGYIFIHRLLQEHFALLKLD
jgi:hypothetical protein